MGVIFTFPQDYPENKLEIEFQSQSLSHKFLEQLAEICDIKSNEFVGRPQVMNLLRFIDLFLLRNPLCAVTDELFQIRQHLAGSNGVLKMKQETSTVPLSARGGYYYFNLRFIVTDDYPHAPISWQLCSSNLPIALKMYVHGQAKKVASQCAERPSNEGGSSKPFMPIPGLEPTAKFIIEAMDGFTEDKCPVCNQLSLPEDPKLVAKSEDDEQFAIRMVCGHIFHQGCLQRYLSEPPIPPDGKLCPARSKHPRSDINVGMGEQTEPCQEHIRYDAWAVNNINPELSVNTEQAEEEVEEAEEAEEFDELAEEAKEATD